MEQVTVGRIVHYRLPELPGIKADSVGQIRAAIVSRVLDPENGVVNLQIIMDRDIELDQGNGAALFRMTQVEQGTDPGTWCWPPRQTLPAGVPQQPGIMIGDPPRAMLPPVPATSPVVAPVPVSSPVGVTLDPAPGDTRFQPGSAVTATNLDPAPSGITVLDTPSSKPSGG